LISSNPSDPLRILLILPEFPPHFGGMQTHAIYLSNYLSLRGHAVEVMTYQSTDFDIYRQGKDHDAQCSFPVYRVLSRIGFWENIRKIVMRATAFRPDLIYASNIYYGLVCDFVRVPITCRSVGNDVLRPWIAYPFKYGSSFLSNPRLEAKIFEYVKRMDIPYWADNIFQAKRMFLVNESLSKISHVFANSHFTADVLRQMGADSDRISVLSGGVDTLRFDGSNSNAHRVRNKLNLPVDGHLIMTACRLVPKKGLDFLLAAFSVLRFTTRKAYLVVIGDGKERTKCEQLAHSLGISERLIFTGYVPHNMIHEYYWACDVFVLASRTCYNHKGGTKDVETMGRVLCEANASGIPVVASNSGGISSVITHQVNGLLFREDDLGDFLKQLFRLQADLVLCKSLIRNGKKRAREHFDWSVLLREHEALFREIKMNGGATGNGVNGGAQCCTAKPPRHQEAFVSW
jgi:phosphatidyl-myo-inositol dimannoside synthase